VNSQSPPRCCGRQHGRATKAPTSVSVPVSVWSAAVQSDCRAWPSAGAECPITRGGLSTSETHRQRLPAPPAPASPPSCILPSLARTCSHGASPGQRILTYRCRAWGQPQPTADVSLRRHDALRPPAMALGVRPDCPDRDLGSRALLAGCRCLAAVGLVTTRDLQPIPTILAAVFVS
jgi:hypothetical protein